MFRLRIIVILLMMPHLAGGQGTVGGLVVDSLTREPLPFVNIIYNSRGNGVITDKDGRFNLSGTQNVEHLEFRYLGYGNRIVHREDFSSAMLVELSPAAYYLTEAVVYPGDNPAHRIIKLASANRAINHPEKSGPFTYEYYEKVIFDILPDSSDIAGSKNKYYEGVDSLRYGRNLESTFDIGRLFTTQYLFMMENISRRKFMQPGRDKEEVLASRISGLSQPSFTILARQLQSFSFYDDLITIGAGSYLSPLSRGSTEKYYFLLRDTLLSDNDTVFIISFTPRDRKNFNGLEGMLHINTAGYAVQNVIASGAGDMEEDLRISIRQQYERIEGKRWFPVALDTDITLPGISPPGTKEAFIVHATGRSAITNININPGLSKNDFDEVALEINEDAGSQPPELWESFRPEPLNERELETYRVIDSIGKSQNMDLTISSVETLVTGFIQGKFFNTDVRRFLGYNRYEGYRLGFGGMTTDRVSRIFSLDGYLAYGLKDKDFKYGGGITFSIDPVNEIDVRAGAWHDVIESGGTGYNQTLSLSGSEFFRSYMVSMMDISDGADITLGFRAMKFLTGDVFLKRFVIIPAGDYSYIIENGNPALALTRFDFAETGVRLRYAYNETFISTPRGNKFSAGTTWPVLYFNILKGIKAFGADYSYYRAEARLTKTIRSASFGETSFSLEGGIVTRGVPYNRLFSGRASYGKFTVESWQSFGTMRLNEFLSDRFVSFFVRHDFGNLLFKPRGKFRPELEIVHNMGFGGLSNSSLHANVEVQSFEKGFFEAGLLINNLLRIQILKYGLGIFYRYGPYAFPETIDNFALKFTLQFNI